MKFIYNLDFFECLVLQQFLCLTCLWPQIHFQMGDKASPKTPAKSYDFSSESNCITCFRLLVKFHIFHMHMGKNLCHISLYCILSLIISPFFHPCTTHKDSQTTYLKILISPPLRKASVHGNFTLKYITVCTFLGNIK